MTYPGGKNGPGVYQTIISRMPPHRLYIEGYLGHGAIMRHKRPADLNIGVDIDPNIIRKWESKDLRYMFHADDFIAFLDRSIRYGYATFETMIYLDPPYLPETRRRSDDLYRFEMSEKDHVELLEKIRYRHENIMISGYMSDLYQHHLKHWRVETYQTVTRGGTLATEHLWMNYPKPETLHDYRYLGSDRTDRQRIKRKIERQIRRIGRLDRYERQAILIETLRDLPKSERSKIIDSLSDFHGADPAQIKLTT